MAGLYIHIPFCKKACYYCDFHFVANLKNMNSVINSIITEIEQRSYEWKDFNFDTIYFGGGTPSVLRINDIETIVNAIYKNYNIAPNPEFTFETNPDDLTLEYLKSLSNYTPINRLSIGIQSFQDDILKFLNRRHDGKQAIESIKNARLSGFENITIDLIYGIPGLGNENWKKNVMVPVELELPHLSSYHLSIEPKTVFGVMQKKHKLNPVNEECSIEQYNILIETLNVAGFEHYEISNFAKNNQYSKHNSSYWKNIPYIGIGPSAHSYDGNSRRWNISNNTIYSQSKTNSNSSIFETEILTQTDMFNDYILTRLRTVWGADLTEIRTAFGEEFVFHCENTLKKKGIQESIIRNGDSFKIDEKNWLIADYIMREFLVV